MAVPHLFLRKIHTYTHSSFLFSNNKGNSFLLQLLKPISSVSPFSFLSTRSYSMLSKSLLDKITEAFHQENPKIMDPLSLSKLQENHVDSILFNMRTKPISAIRFFEWSENVLGFDHKIHSFCGLLHLLLSNRMFDPARLVLGKMVVKFGPFDCFGVFLSGFRIYESNRSTVYSFLIDSFCRLGMVDRSVEIFFRLCSVGVAVSPYALCSMLSCLVDLKSITVILNVADVECSGLRVTQNKSFNLYAFVVGDFFKKGDVQMGLDFHQAMIAKGFMPQIKQHHVDSVLVSLRSKPSSAIWFVEWSENVFGFDHGINSFCGLSHLLLNNRLFDPARRVFNRMVEKFGDFDCFGAFYNGLQVYNSNPSTVYSFLIDNFCRLGMIDRSVEMFFQMSEVGILISPYAVCSLLNRLVDCKSIDVILDMSGELCSGRMDQTESTNLYAFVMGGFFKKSDFKMGLEFHKAMIDRGFLPDIVTCNKIIKGLCNNNLSECAYHYFSTIIEVGPNPTLVTFSTLINSFCKELRLEEAFKLYDSMIAKCITPDVVIYSILVDGLFSVGKFEEGHKLLSDALQRAIKLDVVLFSTVMDAYLKSGDFGRGVDVYKRMLKEGIKPSVVTYGILVNGLCHLGRLSEALGVLGQILKHGIEPSLLLYSSLIDSICKSGNLRDGIGLYKDVVKNGHTPDALVYSIIINCLSKQRRMVEALSFLGEALKRGLKPNAFTLNSLIDDGCGVNQIWML